MNVGEVILGIVTVIMICGTIIVLFAPREEDTNKKKK